MYRYIQTSVSPLVANSYMENIHHIFFLNPRMEEMQHILSTFRTGTYGGEKGKHIDHEVVHINRLTAKLTPVNEKVFNTKGNHIPLDLADYKLYRYKTQNNDDFVTPNYTATPGDNGTWSLGNGHYDSSNMDAFRFGPENGSFDVDMQFGYDVYLLIKFNKDGTVNVGRPNRNYEGVLTFDMNHIVKFEPAYYDMTKSKNGSKSAGGWTDMTKDTYLEQYGRNAMFFVEGEPKIACRYSDEKQQYYFGYVTSLEQSSEKVCTTGEKVLSKDNFGKWVPKYSIPNQFQYLDLQNSNNAYETVTALDDAPFCVVELKEYYGAGYVNKYGQCVQDNMYWKGEWKWKFNQHNYLKFKYFH